MLPAPDAAPEPPAIDAPLPPRSLLAQPLPDAAPKFDELAPPEERARPKDRRRERSYKSW
jgi:hypothetical protein